MDLVGKILGNRYEVIEKIGSGGMATVYEAKCKLLNRKVAIKVLKDEFSNDAEFIKRFQVEAQSAASLSHPNIVSIYDVGDEDGLHYIVMEIIKGKTLKEIIKENGRLPWEEAVNIASQIASGLEQAHKNHIVHRDIKPHNIIITKDGVAKVTDFGIAKAVSNSTINAYSTTVGSVHYFSPEHARGGYTDEKSDIYSLGVVLYEMVTGRLPYEGDTPVTVALKHLQEEAEPPKSIVSTIPESLNQIIMKAMKKEVSERYNSATLMKADLKKVLNSPNAGVMKITVSKTDYPTQKVPIVGITDSVEEINMSSNNFKNKNGEEKTMGKKKKITKKQAVLRIILFLFLGLGIVLGTALITNSLLEMMDGNQPIKVPTVINLHKDMAKEELEKYGFTMKIDAIIESEEFPKDYIADQEYEGLEMKKGSEIKVKVSKGGKTVLVPNITTSTLREAQLELSQRNLKFEVVEEYNDNVPEGSIIKSIPTVNAEVPEGTVITIVVSLGSSEGLVEVPDVMSKTEAEARQILSTAKLMIEVHPTKKEDQPDGVIVDQTPEAGSLVSEMTLIKLMVNNLDGNTEDKPNENQGNDKPNNNENTKPEEGTILPIVVSNKGARDVFSLKVEVQSSLLGKKIIYENMHSRSDGTVNVTIPKGVSGMLRVYIDDKLDSEMTI